MLKLKIEILKKVKGIDKILVSSNCDIMLGIAKELGVEVHKRDEQYCNSNVTQQDFHLELANIIDVNRSTISHILSGRNKPSIDFLEKLLSVYPELNLNWLITGIGYMNIKDSNNATQSEKKLSKIVVLYNDKSFDELEP